MRRYRCLVVFLVIVAIATRAVPGAAELALDRAAVTELVAAVLPRPIAVGLAGVGEVTVRLSPPRTVEFRDGGIEADLPVRTTAFDWSGELHVRWEPRVEPIEGAWHLVATEARLDTALPFAVDVTSWLPPVELPRRFDLDPGLSQLPLPITAYVQSVTISSDRLILGFHVGRGPNAQARSGP